jgi:glycosyltransferase involved in cell wall biosynthesis
VVVINDAGPDPELNALLRSLAARELFVLEQHRSNQGFVKTVNHGLRLCKGRDVVILNSDTVVYNDWLDRLLAHADQHPRLASITLVQQRHDLQLPRDAGRQPHGAGAQPRGDRPPGRGGEPGRACRGPHRRGLLHVHAAQRAGRGWRAGRAPLRARLRRRERLVSARAAQGWRNAIACDVYVRHVGSVSFKGEALQRTGRR